MKCMTEIQDVEFDELVPVSYLHILYKYLFLYEEIYQIKEITQNHIEKFLVYWYPRNFLDFSDDDIRAVIKNTKIYINWCKRHKCVRDIDLLSLNEIEEELLKIRRISSKISSLKIQIKRTNVKAGRSIWIEDSIERHVQYEMLTSWFYVLETGMDNCLLKRVKDNHIFYLENDSIIRNLGLKDEIVTLEIYKERGELWRITNIGLVYSSKAKKYL